MYMDIKQQRKKMTETKEAGLFDFEKLTLAELLMTDFLTCDQCQRRYDHPVLLPCLHTLCEDCVMSLMSSQNSEQADNQRTDTDITNKDQSHDPTLIAKTDEQAGSITTDRSEKLKSRSTSEAQLNCTNKDECHESMARAKTEEQATSINTDKSQKPKLTSSSEAQLNSVNREGIRKPTVTTNADEQYLTTKDNTTIKTNAQLNSMNKKGKKNTLTPRTDAQMNSIKTDGNNLPASKSTSRTDGKLNSTKMDKNQKPSLMTGKSDEPLNSINMKGGQKSTSKTKTEMQATSNSKNADGKQMLTSKSTPRRNDEKLNSTNKKSLPTSECTPKTDAQLNSPNTEDQTTPMSTERTDLDFNTSSIDQGLLTFLTLNCDVDVESTSTCDSSANSTRKTKGETKPSHISDTSPNIPNKSNENGVKLIRIQCPVCLAVMKTSNESLKLANTFVKHLCDVRSYKEVNGRTCEYCKFDGKITTATTLCLSCHDDMCDGCVKAHQRTRVTRDHQLAPYEQIQKGLYDHDIRNHQSIFCLTHNREVELFCLTCAVLLCNECTDIHGEHKVKPVTKTFPKYKQQLESFLQGMKRRIPTVADYSSFLTNHSKQMITSREEIEKSIDEQAKLLHKLIDEHKVRLIDNLTTACDQELQVIQSKCKDLSTADKSLTKNAEFLSHLLKFGKPEEVLVVHQPITNRLKQLVHMKPDSLKMRLTTSFKPGSATEQNIAIMFGNLNIEKVPFNQEESKQTSLTVASLMPTVLSPPELMQSFDMRGVNDSSDVWPTGLMVTNTNYIIVDRDNKMVKIFDKNGRLENQFNGKDENRLGSPFDATILKNGNIAVTDYKSEDVKIFDPSGEFIRSIKGHFRYPRGITTNRKGDIVVVDCHRLQITTHSAETGECLSTISGTDEVNKHLVDPYYIAVTDDDNFVVTDHAAPNIKIFNETGECLAQYGTYGTYQGQVLQPYGVCVDRHGYIFVADHQNSRIHLLLPDGRFSNFLLTKRDKLRNPVAIGIDKNDQLVVAEALGKVKVWKYM
ncbi:B-box type zinc finger protein ncl-1-like [Gigantopelta aegis]|uniref:B-box type zinc finger protein ncl-1-like n=1 Tax=Gigantopelta aegis TaxID=1735272 RepID=UPI001B88D57D|nr:B-box type zinc finger protein ncl-1-like [Gigantopelta aegis]